MPKSVASRKRRFRAALALAGLDAKTWAAQQGVTAGHLSQVLDGKRESRSLVEKVEAFTRKYATRAALMCE